MNGLCNALNSVHTFFLCARVCWCLFANLFVSLCVCVFVCLCVYACTSILAFSVQKCVCSNVIKY